MSQLPMESTDAEFSPEHRAWLNSVTKKFSAFVQNKVYTDTLQAFVWKHQPRTYTSTPNLNLEKGCWWLPISNGALGVLVAPFRKDTWYNKHQETLGLPAHNDTLRGVFFANVGRDGVPLLAPSIGVISTNWSVDSSLQVFGLEEGSSKSIARQHQHWGSLAHALWCAAALNQVARCDENNVGVQNE